MPGRARGDRQDQGDGVVPGLPAAEGQRSLQDGPGDLLCGHVAQGREEVAETVVAVKITVGRAARLDDAVAEQDQAVTRSQQDARVGQLGMSQQPEQGSRLAC